MYGTFRLKMHMACANDDLRPQLQCVYFDNGKMVATDAHVLIVADVKQFSGLDDENVEKLNGKFIHKKTFAQIIKRDYIQVMDDGIMDTETKDVFAFARGIDMPYPNYKAVLPISGTEQEINEIGIGPKVASTLFNILKSSEFLSLRAKFYGKDKPIVLTANDYNEDTFKSILMPTMIID